MRVLLFCNDFHHPGEVPIKGMEPLREKGYKIDVISDTANFDAAVIFEYDAVIMSKCDHISRENKDSWKTPQVQAAFVEFVEKGGGLLVTHNGTVPGSDSDAKGNDTTVLDRLAGCHFVSHPNNCPVTVAPLKPHPIVEGVELFCEVDEHYRLEILADDIDVIAAGYAPAQGDPAKYETEPYFNYPECIAPSVFVRTQGKGSVCVLTPGHGLNVWHNPQFQKMLENALNWCAGK
ncbi:MAG: ThuA domain-containing protein [Firmicutes bacterium]|nr:ThuA domain-containing protein [Bacillota bacterium]